MLRGISQSVSIPKPSVWAISPSIIPAPAVKPQLPLRSKTENMEVIALTNRAAFIVARRKRTGWFGFPHTFAEKELSGFPATITTLVNRKSDADMEADP